MHPNKEHPMSLHQKEYQQHTTNLRFEPWHSMPNRASLSPPLRAPSTASSGALSTPGAVAGRFAALPKAARTHTACVEACMQVSCGQESWRGCEQQRQGTDSILLACRCVYVLVSLQAPVKERLKPAGGREATCMHVRMQLHMPCRQSQMLCIPYSSRPKCG